jgi:hypothetical protein
MPNLPVKEFLVQSPLFASNDRLGESAIAREAFVAIHKALGFKTKTETWILGEAGRRPAGSPCGGF